LRYSKSRRSLVGAINDPSALGALRAFQEAGRTDSCAIMGQNASPKAAPELREPGTRLVGSVAYFPEKYGAEIVAVALDILHRRAVPPAVFVKHQLVTPETVEPHLSERRVDAGRRTLRLAHRVVVSGFSRTLTVRLKADTDVRCLVKYPRSPRPACAGRGRP
jgi:hypothetical protein